MSPNSEHQIPSGHRKAVRVKGKTMRGVMTASRDYDYELSELNMISRLVSPEWRPNMLIVCSEAERESVTRRAAIGCRQPVHFCRLPGPLNLPGSCGTLVLSDMAAMEVNQQLALYDWISEHPHTRIVSVTSADVPALIANALFLEGLYYRLNTVRVEAKEHRAPLRTQPKAKDRLYCLLS